MAQASDTANDPVIDHVRDADRSILLALALTDLTAQHRIQEQATQIEPPGGLEVGTHTILQALKVGVTNLTVQRAAFAERVMQTGATPSSVDLAGLDMQGQSTRTDIGVTGALRHACLDQHLDCAAILGSQ